MIEGSALEATLSERAEAAVATETPVVSPAAPAPSAATERSALRFAKNIALFFAAPLVGLAYALAFPLIGIGMLAWHGGQALARRSPRTALIAKRAGMLAIAPLAGLAYTIVLPFVGFGMLVLVCAKPLFSRAGRE
jgi:hypothetical protein